MHRRIDLSAAIGVQNRKSVTSLKLVAAATTVTVTLTLAQSWLEKT